MGGLAGEFSIRPMGEYIGVDNYFSEKFPFPIARWLQNVSNNPLFF
jgi:hypothetical protein